MPLPHLLLDTSVAVPDVASTSDGEETTLDIDVPHQKQTLWCWCAVTVGVSRFFEPTFALSQCETAARVLLVKDACMRPTDDDVDRMFDLRLALGTFGRVERVIDEPLSFEDVEREIQALRPVGVQILFQDSGRMHFTIIRGCRRVAGERILVIDDPQFDESESSYERFRSFYRGDGEWQRSYITR
jgi:hypothetical protein